MTRRRRSRRTGLHERRAEWRARLVARSGEDLVPLAGALQDAVDDIENRLEPINEILATLPFGATQDRLRIRMRRLAPANVAQFRADLRSLSSTATKQLTDDQLEARFHALQQFMGRIRRRDDPRANPEVADRGSLLDVRRHVEITAELEPHMDKMLAITKNTTTNYSFVSPIADAPQP